MSCSFLSSGFPSDALIAFNIFKLVFYQGWFRVFSYTLFHSITYENEWVHDVTSSSPPLKYRGFCYVFFNWSRAINNMIDDELKPSPFLIR